MTSIISESSPTDSASAECQPWCCGVDPRDLDEPHDFCMSAMVETALGGVCLVDGNLDATTRVSIDGEELNLDQASLLARTLHDLVSQATPAGPVEIETLATMAKSIGYRLTLPAHPTLADVSAMAAAIGQELAARQSGPAAC